jgi:hypothetical protein
MTEKPLAGLRDEIYDRIAAGRDSIEVSAPRISPDGAEFDLSFKVKIDAPTLALLAKVADRRGRSLNRALRRYTRDAFKECFGDDDGRNDPSLACGHAQARETMPA